MLFDKLKANRRIPFHMPGHKRNTKLLGKKLPYDIDITEIDGFDNLHSPRGVIKEIEDKAKRIYNSDNSFVLVNGSTVGILSGVAAVLSRGDDVLIARNCHKSVYNAVELVGARAHYITPETDEYGVFQPLNPAVLKRRLEEVKPKLLVITSPTYEGVCSDIEGICELAHSYNIPVLLDSAHGAHMYELGSSADIVVMSLHKTLPALTQCALAHINGDLVSAEKFRIKLSVFETSSPSYVLMSSVDECLSLLENESYKTRSLEYVLKRADLNDGLADLKHLKLLEYDDIYKLVIFSGYSDLSGIELANVLRESYNIEVEMATASYVVLITTECDDFWSYKLLQNALKEIDASINKTDFESPKAFPIPKKQCEACEVKDSLAVDLSSSEGKISAEYVWAYPPGIPLIVPGEVVSREIIDYISSGVAKSVNIQSTFNMLPEKIYCQS